ncbi:response regulator transcription factor [Salmonella enterica]|nr:response regulator transcription factor [Salmonella enterica]EIO8806981.1 response regulator transcription factor [Salmonella enterica]EIW4249650.1 response regulator transcription factor [Salmonella enterica]EIY5616290.1 response regulator transcription factor [Salmonella enterica]EJA6066851.1 response regulator transcription factor [Salmonella enterica]
MKKIAILDRNGLSLTGIEHMLKDMPMLDCFFATQDTFRFNDILYRGFSIDGAVISFYHGSPDSLLAINEFIASYGANYLIVMLESRNKHLLNLIYCMNVSWVLFFDESIIQISRKINMIFSNKKTGDMTSRPGLLTTREIEVLTALLGGLSTESVAKKMYLSIKTISSHKKKALNKLGLTRFNQLLVSSLIN